MQKQLFQYTEKILSPFLCGYKKGFSTQTALLGLAKNWKASLDKKGYAGAVLIDLLKAFDTTNHGLLLAKLNAYGFDKISCKIMSNYLSNCQQRTKINTTFSSWSAQFWDQFCLKAAASYKMITSQNLSFEVQVKNFCISQKSYMFCSQDIQVFVFLTTA